MKVFRSDLLLNLVLFAFCLVNCRDILVAWRDAPYERGGWLVLLAWAVPLVLLRAQTIDRRALVAGMVMSVLGNIADLNVLHHIGFVLACLAFVKPLPLPYRLLLLFSACWIPAFGWMAARLALSPLVALSLRFLLAGVVGALVVAWERSHLRRGVVPQEVPS